MIIAIKTSTHFVSAALLFLLGTAVFANQLDLSSRLGFTIDGQTRIRVRAPKCVSGETWDSNPTTQASLDRLFRRATRMRVVQLWVAETDLPLRVKEGVLLDTTDRQKIDGVHDLLRLKRNVNDSMIFGWSDYRLEIYEGDKLLGALDLFTPRFLSWRQWKYDAEIANPEALRSWLISSGAHPLP
jgi:hypothetical protein